MMLLPMRTARRRRNDAGSSARRQHDTCGGIVNEWQSSEPLEVVPRGRIPVPSRDIRRRIGLSGDVVDQWRVLLILRRRLVWFFAKQGKLVSSVSAAFRMGGGLEAVGPHT